VNGYTNARAIATVVEFLNSCQDGTNERMCSWILLESNDIKAKISTLNTGMTYNIIFMT